MRARSFFFSVPAAALVERAIATATPKDGPGKKIWAGGFTSEQAARGKTNFDLSCSRCHNVALIGSDRGPAIKGNTFLSHWEKDTIAGLFTKVRDTRPESGPGAVPDEVRIAIIS